MFELYDHQNSTGLINDLEEKLVDNRLEEMEYNEYKVQIDKLENKKKYILFKV